jgi:hypothetical protein
VSKEPAVAFLVGSRETGIYSQAWRLWWRGTDFYLKPRGGLDCFKISLHGPKTGHTGTWYKIENDHASPKKQNVEPTSVLMADPSSLPLTFTGHVVSRRLRHVVRVRSSWDMHLSNAVSAPVQGDIPSNIEGRLAQPPRRFHATDVDIFISDGQPRWPAAEKTLANNAALPPLLNPHLRQSLTARVVQRSLTEAPTPKGVYTMAAAPTDDRVRGLGVEVDSLGVLWIVEMYLSRTTVNKWVQLQAEQP